MLRYIIKFTDKYNRNIYLSEVGGEILDFSCYIVDAIRFSTEDNAEEFYIKNEEKVWKLMKKYNSLEIDFPEIDYIYA